MLKKLLETTRSYRRFLQTPAPDLMVLRNLVELTRLTPSASNQQPLRYCLVTSKGELDKIFSCLTWAGFLHDWEGPAQGERPTAYIVILSDPNANPNPQIDVGLAAQTMLLGARELGFGGCLLGSVDRPRLQQLLKIPQELEIHLVMALGTPGEEVRLTTVGSDDDTRYWRDNDDIHYVPKHLSAKMIIHES